MDDRDLILKQLQEQQKQNKEFEDKFRKLPLSSPLYNEHKKQVDDIKEVNEWIKGMLNSYK